MGQKKKRLFNGIYITAHAEMRAKQRLQMNFKDLCQDAFDSLEKGIDALGDPTLRDMVIDRAVRHGASGIYAYKGVLYIFVENAVVTVYPLQWIAIPDYSTAS